MENMDIKDLKGKKEMASNRRVLCLCIALVTVFIVALVLVGVLVWKFSKCNDNATPLSENFRGKMTFGTTTEIPRTTSDLHGDGPWKNLRLSRSVVPIHYGVTLYPDFYESNGWFYGNETILLNVTEITRYILIHINYLNITKTQLRFNSTGDIIPINEPFEYLPNQFWVIQTKMPIPGGTLIALDLQFDGSLTRAIVGFYKSTYINHITNETRYLATSKFEPVAARRAFPCFDEPNMKAEFTVTLVHRPNYIALSNMPVEQIGVWTFNNRLQSTRFRKSVKMSTYLVCFIVCDFAYREATTKSNTTVRVYATPDRVEQVNYALDVARVAMELYENLFNVSYPLPKQDLIAIPDFVSGAMEHWGLITFREVNLLFNENEASGANKQRVNLVVSHEVSHQTWGYCEYALSHNSCFTVKDKDLKIGRGKARMWNTGIGKWFGNLVTMDWWDDLWLNEGFATFMEYIGANEKEHDWDMTDQFVTDEVQTVMVLDAGESSHPIINNVENPDQINEVFDAISYSKGASVIKMLETTLGTDSFFKGVSQYLHDFSYRNAKTDDLWAKLGTVGNTSVKAMMDTWTRQMGFPYINVTIISNMHEVQLDQKRFGANSSMAIHQSEAQFGYKWIFKVDYATNTGETSNCWIHGQERVSCPVKLNLSADTSWIKLNLNQTGYYRVNYPDIIWRRFPEALKRNITILSPADRSGLIDDAFNLARGGYIDYELALGMTSYLDTEMEYTPWKSAAEGLNFISRMFSFTPHYGLWQRYISSKATPILREIGNWNDTGTHLQKLLRSQIIDLACGNGNDECLDTASTYFQAWIRNTSFRIPPNLRSAVYTYGMMRSTKVNDWEFLWNRYLNEAVPQEKIKLLYGLAQTKETWLLVRFIEYAKDEEKVRSQDFWTVLTYISQNPVGKGLVWDWIRDNWMYMINRFTLYSRYFGRLIPSVVSDFNTRFQLVQVKDFFTKYPEAGAGGRGRQQALESIEGNIAWMDTNKEKIINWLLKTVKQK